MQQAAACAAAFHDAADCILPSILRTPAVPPAALQLLKQREEDARQQAAHSAVILQRAEAERRRISDKYTRQRAQAKEMLEDFKRVRGVRIFRVLGFSPDAPERFRRA
jgi:hypothetical protein